MGFDLARGIRSVNQYRDEKTGLGKLHVVFGPHYFLEIEEQPDGKTSFIIGATHHGFRADASVPGGELETFIEQIRNKYPDHMHHEGITC